MNTCEIPLQLFSVWLDLQLIVHIIPHVFTPLFYIYTHKINCKFLDEKGGSHSYRNLINAPRREKLIWESKYRCAPTFRKVHIMPLRFYERLPLVPDFPNWKNCEEHFCFHRKWRKAKIMFSVCFTTTLGEAASAPSCQSGPAELLLGELQSASQHQAP